MVVCFEAVLADSCGVSFKSGIKGGMYICHHLQDNDIFLSRKVCKNDIFLILWVSLLYTLHILTLIFSCYITSAYML
jgi:hypothetical protein